ncbi:MAG: hypothetical protein U9Q76_07495 [candidate division WOR-3 bacterium]|nr:hypothetical protein [candidate division WOR-3 bacterium]
MRLDHFLIHVDNDAAILEELKETIVPLGFPFDPGSEKSTHGLAVSNIWIGEQYLQIVRLLQPSVRGWNPRWVECYSEGKRGVFSIFIAVKELDEVYEGLVERGIEIPEPKQSLVKTSKEILEAVTGFLGIGQSKQKKISPWRSLNLPPIPGTDMDISFLEYHEDSEEDIKLLMKPNAEEYGITGIHRAKIYLPLWENGIGFLQKVFPQLIGATTQQKVELKEDELLFFRSDPEAGLKVKLEATSEQKKYTGNKFQIENLEVKTVSA